MQQQIGLNIQQYLDALHEIEDQVNMSSASLVLHPNGAGAVRLDTFFNGSVSVDFDTDDGDDIMDAIHRLAEKAKEIGG